MFNFKQEGKEVKIEIEAKSKVPARWFCFTWHCNDEVYADLLIKSFESNLTDKIKTVREESYNQGWKDAKAKRKRETWFGGWL